AYKTAMSSEGKVGPAHRALGVLYDDRFGSAREQEAAKTYKQFLEIRDDPEILARLGLILVEDSLTLDEAGVLFGKALRLEPGLEKAKYGRALVSYKQGRISEASSIICELARA
ncbi:MAG: hypothetical protein RDV41_01415, partial [Planctomycetota bacterium]|nr:hypothetical protein [Planctomycetota bacterium]